MSLVLQQYSPPTLPVLRWLTDAGPRVPTGVREVLIAELYSSPVAVLMAVVSSILLDVAGLVLHYEPAYVVFLLLDVAFAAARIAAIAAARRSTAQRRRTPTDAYLILVVAWCALQGSVAFTAMQSGSPTLEIVAATTIMGLIGPLCARHYPAPRLTFLLVCLCDLPFVAGCMMSGNYWLMILAVQAPLYLYGSIRIITHFKALAVATLKAEQENRHRAHHDPLTGLLNRFGLLDTLDRFARAGLLYGVTLCLDLDGFKQVNDTLGHHVGDALLQAVARRLEANVRPQDALIRLGGDEFVILTQDMAPPEAQDFAERLIEQVTAEPFLLEGVHLVRLGLSIGFACAPYDGTDFESLHRKADVALYAAKAAGKGVARQFAPPLRLTEACEPRLSGTRSSAASQAH